MGNLQSANDALFRTTQELEITLQRLEAQSEEANALRLALERQADESDHLPRAASELAREVDDLRQSLSWRCMAPARMALRLLRGR